MASNFDRWEKDPFFPAAEEVQDSADRMESAYRTWIHEIKDAPSIYESIELRRDLHTALGTAKWQLEEFEGAIRSSYIDRSAEFDRARHRQFISAIENQISTIEDSLKESVLADGETTLPWVRLDKGERDELALFLSGSSADSAKISGSVPGKDEEKCRDKICGNGHVKDEEKCREKICGNGHVKDEEKCNSIKVPGETILGHSKNASHSVDWDSQETREERLHGHRRTASATDIIGDWKIGVADEDFGRSTDGKPDLPPPRILSLSGFLKTMESASKLKWSKSGFRKWKCGDRHHVADTAPLRSHQLSRDIHACYEGSKGCLDCCDDSYDKQLKSWFGAVQRQIQRSQYQIQYGRPIQVTLWAVLVLCSIGLFVLRVI